MCILIVKTFVPVRTRRFAPGTPYASLVFLHLPRIIWYHTGTLDETGVTWGASRRAGISGHKPAVALSKEGYVILVFSDQDHKNGSNLIYQVGRIDPYGGRRQSIAWLTDAIGWDRGFHNAIAINDNGIIVGVHETGHASTGLYYRVGRFADPAAGAYTIHWDSGVYGIKYDDGINPHIAINNQNQVVAVHQVSSSDFLLHYRRGTVIGGVIHFGESRRYDNYAIAPAVALLDSGLVLEVHCLGGFVSRTGRLSPIDPEVIDWAEPVMG